MNRGHLNTDTHTLGKQYEKMKAEIRETLLQAKKKYQVRPDAKGDAQNGYIFLQQASELTLRIPPSQTSSF